ncbi:unnamed protein product [Larinioides sclopetarius]|uniref:Uncharacterized protein n=1 Tax=Larinioides sclopetarius TaxID=280406 RepID=A0AAV1ZKM9_9ARAC
MNHISSLHAAPPENSRVVEFVAEKLKTNDSDVAKFYAMKFLKAKIIRQLRNGSLYLAKDAFTNLLEKVAPPHQNTDAFTNLLEKVAPPHQNTGIEKIWIATFVILLLSFSINLAMFCYAFYKIIKM